MAKLKYMMAILVFISCTHKTNYSLLAQDVSDTIEGYVWHQVLPFRSGSFPEEWKPGTFPLGLVPVQAFGGDLWMSWNKYAWSSPDGIKWTVNSKTDWGERISTSQVFFKNKLWIDINTGQLIQ